MVRLVIGVDYVRWIRNEFGIQCLRFENWMTENSPNFLQESPLIHLFFPSYQQQHCRKTWTTYCLFRPVSDPKILFHLPTPDSNTSSSQNEESAKRYLVFGLRSAMARTGFGHAFQVCLLVETAFSFSCDLPLQVINCSYVELEIP